MENIFFYKTASSFKCRKICILMILSMLFNLTFLKAQNEKIDLALNNVNMQQFFSSIEDITSYTFTYRDNMLAGKEKVSVKLNNKSITETLDSVLPVRGLSYTINGNSIQISIKGTMQDKKQISGRVTDENGELLIGVSVIDKDDNQNGAITDLDGLFSLRVSDNSKLILSYVGYVTQTISVKGKTDIAVVMVEESSLLNEVVVVGYGVQKKVNLTGSVASVKGERIASQPVISLKDALAGLIPGMTVTKDSGKPGSSNPVIRVRGIGTWQNSSPLILVDGISMSIADVMPNDIESMSVLKDAASAAIYGSRAANGVILITTKQGKKGQKLRVDYNSNIGFQNATRRPKMAKSWQYAKLYNQAMTNDGKANADGTTSQYPQDKIDRMMAGGDPDVLEGSTDWFKEILETAPQYKQDIMLSGGSDKVAYVASLGWAYQKGVIKSSYERYNTRLNTTSDVTDWFKLISNIAYITDESKDSGAGEAYYYVPRAFPYMPVKFSDGTWSFHSTPKNPVRMTTGDYGYEKYQMDKLSLLVSPELTFLDKSLIAKGVLGYESKTAYVDKATRKVLYEAFEPAGQAENLYVSRNEKKDTWRRNRNLTLSATLNYIKSFGKHDINLLLGGSRETFKFNETIASRKDFPTDDFGVIGLGDKNTAAAEGYKDYAALASVFGRINYAFDNRYLFEANLRRDGSSKFARGERWGTFPSFSGAWRISEEKFFDPAKSLVQNLKLRASWGRLGNQQISNYQSLSAYAQGASYLFGDKNVINNEYYESIMGNKMITWETSDNLNFGIDVNVLNSRLGLTFDWYRKKTKDILLQLEAPAMLGAKPAMSNAGVVENKGWELNLSWHDRPTKDFGYRVNFMLSDVKNKILDLKGYKSPTGSLTTRMEGQPIDALYGWETLGIADTQEKYEKYKDVMLTYNPYFAMGDIIIKDLQEEGQEGYGTIDANDKKIIGNTIPRYTFSLELGADYKGFDFSAMFQGVGKRDSFLGRDAIEPLGPMTALKDHFEDSFDPKNPSSGKYYPRMSMESRLNYANMSHWVQDASYIRLKNIQIGYTFKFSKEVPIERLRLSFSGQNLFTITSFKVFDPEAVINNISFPNVATYNFGVNVVF